jgi:hypothetical protein
MQEFVVIDQILASAKFFIADFTGAVNEAKVALKLRAIVSIGIEKRILVNPPVSDLSVQICDRIA